MLGWSKWLRLEPLMLGGGTNSVCNALISMSKKAASCRFFHISRFGVSHGFCAGSGSSEKTA